MNTEIQEVKHPCHDCRRYHPEFGAIECTQCRDAPTKEQLKPYIEYIKNKKQETPTIKFTPTLFILIRNDLPTLNPGKAAAQASHASAQFVNRFNYAILTHRKDFPGLILSQELSKFYDWSNQAMLFGTTITLEGSNTLLEQTLHWAKHNLSKMNSGPIIDPTYPITGPGDSNTEETTTCVWLFTSDKKSFDKFNLFCKAHNIQFMK